MELIEIAKKMIADSCLGSNPRNRLYVANGAVPLIRDLVEEIKRLRAELSPKVK